jgi:hypothetical protein
MKKYALIIDGCYCGKNTIYGVYDTFQDAIFAARDWIEEHCIDNVANAMLDFADNDFIFLEDYFNIDEFEM